MNHLLFVERDQTIRLEDIAVENILDLIAYDYSSVSFRKYTIMKSTRYGPVLAIYGDYSYCDYYVDFVQFDGKSIRHVKHLILRTEMQYKVRVKEAMKGFYLMNSEECGDQMPGRAFCFIITANDIGEYQIRSFDSSGKKTL